MRNVVVCNLRARKKNAYDEGHRRNSCTNCECTIIFHCTFDKFDGSLLVRLHLSPLNLYRGLRSYLHMYEDYTVPR
jgi:hypothetical protein